MAKGHGLDWPELAQLTAAYNVDDREFDRADVLNERVKRFPEHQAKIQKSLDAITSRGRFEGWQALYQPALPGVLHVQPVISRSDAMQYRNEVHAEMEDAMTYAWDKIGILTDWHESPSRKLSYYIDHPDKWGQLKVGTILQAILSQQRVFFVDVLPRWSTQQGNLRRAEGLDLRQTLQTGLNADDVLEDIGGTQFLGDDRSYDLGIDPEFQ